MRVLTILSLALVGYLGTASASEVNTPEFFKPLPGKDVRFNKMSDNGKWALSTSGTAEAEMPIVGYIYNLETFEQIPVTQASGDGGVRDISDDGNIVVGECEGVPGYWDRSTGTWTKFMPPAGTNIGGFNAVTPDGRYAAGYFASFSNEYLARPMVYDLKEGKRLELPGIPKYDKSHQDRDENALYDISPDGRYVTGMISQAFWKDEDYAPLCCYVYDRQEGTYDMIGYTDYLDKDWVPDVAELHFTIAPQLSNNGEWVTGAAYMVHEIPGSIWPDEGYRAFRYNVKTKKFEVWDNVYDTDITGTAIGNDGVVYGATPADNPYANALVRSGDYFISFEDILSQVYGVNYKELTGKPNFGKIAAISNDGKTLLVNPDSEGTYILRLPDTASEAAKKVKLLGNYQVDPVEGVGISRLTKITLVFDRKVKIRGNVSDITFESADGKEKYTPVASGGVVAEDKRVVITFRSRDLTGGQEYTLTVPEGMIRMDGFEEETNNEIKVKYLGRDNTPVKVLQVQPSDDAYVAKIDVSANPILLQFDTQVKLVDGAHGAVYRNDETTPLSMLYFTVDGPYVIAYPAVAQPLYLDSDYHFVIPEGSLTDISGGGPNEEIQFTYHGSYEREIPSEDNFIFYEDCNDYSHLMFYEGDRLEPADIPAEWGFTRDTTPWLIVRDDESVDMAMATHSMYKPAGQSDNWMVIPKLVIPSEKCYLEFDAQSYLASKKDVLKVYVYESDNVYNTLTTEIIKEIENNGELVFDEQLNPGKSEETLAEDWTHYSIPLAKYTEKPIYIAFVNKNNNQSAIFIDNIVVKHDQVFYVSFDTPSRVVDQESVAVSGTVLFDSEHETFNSISLTLSDADGQQLETIEEKGLELTKGSRYEFKFKKEIGLKLGETNTYYVDVKVSDGKKTDAAKLTGKVADLIFQPKRRIVLEEYTGSTCPNCPLGILGLENLESIFPGTMIPITIRTYQSDKLGIGMEAYSLALGLDQMGAPSGIINRKEAGYPMISVERDYRFTGVGITNTVTGEDERVWLDIVRDEYEIPAEVKVDFSNAYDAAGNKVDVKLMINNALNQYRVNYKVFAVVTEEGLKTFQMNNFGIVADKDLGEWGLGGKYSASVVTDVECHGVARQAWGTTYNGTAGLFPSAMEAGKDYSAEFSISLPSTIADINNCNVVVMILDGGTNQVLNANIAPINGTTDGVNEIADESSLCKAGIAVMDGNLIVNTSSEVYVKGLRPCRQPPGFGQLRRIH